MGPGQVVSLKLEDTIRSHHDLLKGNAPLYTKAIKVSIYCYYVEFMAVFKLYCLIIYYHDFQYFDDLAKRAAENGTVVDMFACSLDQVYSIVYTRTYLVLYILSLE